MPLTLDTEAIVLPTGAWARTHRRYLRRSNGAPVLALTSGDFRPYVFPLYTPAGFAVTSEAPADHPHHQSVWIGADHVHALVPASEGATEEYTYNFYLNDVFQGRAPGRVVETAAAFTAEGDDGGTIRQALEWRGPVEWAAPQGRVIFTEERTLRVRLHPDATVLHIRSRLVPATWAVRLGPTRHAFFNARVAESMQAVQGGRMLDHRGASIGATQTPAAEWIDYVGPVGGGHEAGIALMPLTDLDEGWWFVSDWGVITWGPFRRHAREVAVGETLAQSVGIVAHDGDIESERLSALRSEMKTERESR
ncbi:MAG: DUF6807 family protein [Betaproteobacteria bacterium]